MPALQRLQPQFPYPTVVPDIMLTISVRLGSTWHCKNATTRRQLFNRDQNTVSHYVPVHLAILTLFTVDSRI